MTTFKIFQVWLELCYQHTIAKKWSHLKTWGEWCLFFQIYSHSLLLRCNNLWTIAEGLEIFGLQKWWFFYLAIRKMCRIADRSAQRGLLPSRAVCVVWLEVAQHIWIRVLLVLLHPDCTTGWRPPLASSPQCLGEMRRGSRGCRREKLYDKLTYMHIVKW